MARPKKNKDEIEVKSIEKTGNKDIGYEQFMKEVEKEVDSVYSVFDELKSDSKYIYPFNCSPLDVAFGGGIHSGRIYEFYGPPSQGKSTLTLEAEKAFCNYWKSLGEDKYAILHIESESVFDKIRAKYIGLPIERILISEADTVEKGLITIEKCAEKAIQNNMKLFIDWDTLASIPTEAEMIKGTYGGGMAEKARVLRQAMRKLTSILAQGDISIIFVNQIYASFNQYNPEPISPGGDGIKFHASVRVFVKQLEDIKDIAANGQEVITGILTNCFFRKNKLAMPKQNVPIVINGERGFDSWKTLYRFLVTNKIVNVAGGWKNVIFKDQEFKFQNEEGLKEIIEMREPKLKEFLDYMVIKAYGARSPLMKVKLIENIWTYEERELGGRIT